METYNVYFLARDYEKLEITAKTIRIERDGQFFYVNEKGDIKPITGNADKNDKDKALNILKRFAEAVEDRHKKVPQEKLFLVNKSQGRLNIEAGKIRKKKGLGLLSAGGTGLDGVVGVLRHEFIYSDGTQKVSLNTTLQIDSRFDRRDSDEGAAAQPYFLAAMLLQDHVQIDENRLRSNAAVIFDYLLIFWFREQLEAAYQQGLFKTYRKKDRNDSRFKGTLNVPQQIRLNAGEDNGKIAHSFREKTLGNAMNLLIVTAYEFMRVKYPEYVQQFFNSYNHELLNVIEYLKRETGFTGKEKASEILKRNRDAITHPYYTEYEPLRRICIRILTDEGISLFDENLRNEIQGILYYIPDLWEEYLEKRLLYHVAMKLGLRVDSQALMRALGTKTEPVAEKYNYRMETYPDFIVCDESSVNLNGTIQNPFMILDAKFKPGWGELIRDEKKSTYSVQADYDKCLRDMVSINACSSGVVFPMYELESKVEDWKLYHPFTIWNNGRFYTIPVYVPAIADTDTYQSWKRKFDENLEEALDILCRFIGREQRIYRETRELSAKIQNIHEMRVL